MGFTGYAVRGVVVALSLSAATSAQADLLVTFTEGAPKDSFRILNTGNCTLKDVKIVVDLSTSVGGLIFDVTEQGEGVEVFQPFDLTQGSDALISTPTVSDGQSVVEFDVSEFREGRAIAFTIDVDDTIGTRQITVSGSEIEGGMVSLVKGNTVQSGTFSANAKAEVQLSGC
ncbi:aggregation factor core (plasmid) [Rhodobacteraceae bacterium SC52]|nr:aggregation factor core [Rhodobacteraceae bacterium SC52]